MARKFMIPQTVWTGADALTHAETDICVLGNKVLIVASCCVPPVAAIPTTAGTGSEVTQFTIITDTQTDVKMLGKNR